MTMPYGQNGWDPEMIMAYGATTPQPGQFLPGQTSGQGRQGLPTDPAWRAAYDYAESLVNNIGSIEMQAQYLGSLYKPAKSGQVLLAELQAAGYGPESIATYLRENIHQQEMMWKWQEIQQLGGYDAWMATQGGADAPTFTSECANGTCVQFDQNNQVTGTYPDPNYTPDKPSYTSQCANGTCTQFDENGQAVGNYPDPGYVEPTYGDVKYDQNGNAYQIAPNGQIHYTNGMAPTGQPTDMPTDMQWGMENEEYTYYDPETQTMRTGYRKKPLSWQETLAQSQWANQPGSWLDVGMMERQMAPDQQIYKPTVGETTGRLVSAAPGYAQNYDLQQGQSAYGVTPSGWLQDWQSGYGSGSNPLAGGQGGGYQTQTMGMQDYARRTPDQLGEFGGWLNSGLAGTNPDEYWDQMRKLAPPSGAGTRVSYR